MNSISYLRFYRNNPKMLSFGLLLTLFSNFGQTFLISIFVPQFLEAFSLDTAQFGFLYAGATLASAASLPFFGKQLDRSSLRRFSLAVGVLLAMACLALATATGVIQLFIAILGLRLAGQGLLSLTASTTMARFFVEGRGKALCLSGLGYPLGEGLLPLLVVFLIHGVGWRLSWAVLGGVIALVLLPAMYSLLGGLQSDTPRAAEVTRPGVRDLSLLRDWRFYLLLPGTLFLPFVLTSLFLYQVPLAEARGWTSHTMAMAFIGFALARIAGSLAVGPWIDRVGAVRIFPVVLLPVTAGLAFLCLGSHPWAALVYLSLAGVSQGLTSPMMTALWAEIYGVEALGATKGIVATLGILATALGPLALGSLLTMGISFVSIVQVCVIFGLVASGASLIVRWRLTTMKCELNQEAEQTA